MFLKSFFDWLSRALQLNKSSPAHDEDLIAKTNLAVTLRLSSNQPGVCAAYVVKHSEASSDLIISLISVAQLREDFALGGAYRRSSDPLSLYQTRSFSSQLETFLEDSGGLDRIHITHIFAVAWRSKRLETDMDNRKGYFIRPLATIPCDLVGTSMGWTASNSMAVKICQSMAVYTMRLNASRLNTWEELIQGLTTYDKWRSHLEWNSKKHLGPSHVIQPKRHDHKEPT